ncbi:MAG: hypothetical protein KC425_02810, partial [Anaerolineales bacterium]|nr:hypothetical protein [Anaerolineales bacterium]
MDQHAERESALHTLGGNLLITAGVVVTVVMALLLAQLDTVQTLLPSLPSPIAQLTAPAATGTPLPSTPLPTTTATAVPPTPTPIPAAQPSPTAVAVLASCGDVPTGWVPYTVQPGDSYFFLSANSGATINEIVQA